MCCAFVDEVLGNWCSVFLANLGVTLPKLPFFYSEPWLRLCQGYALKSRGFAVVSLSVSFPIQPKVPFLHLTDIQPETSIQVLYVPLKFPDVFLNPTCSFSLTRCGSCALVQYPSHTLPIETGRLFQSSSWKIQVCLNIHLLVLEHCR